MSDEQMNQLRRELPWLTARIATALASLLDSMEAGPESRAESAAVARAALSDFAGWVRRAAGPEDVLGVRGQVLETRPS